VVSVWRIAQDTPDYEAHDLAGRGAQITGGRWNRKGHAMVYSASSIALAVLETVVHMQVKGLPLNRYLVEISIPDAVWQHRLAWTKDTATVGWDAIPAGKVSLDMGDGWLKSGHSAVALVPSAIVAEEFNILINPKHADAAQISAKKLRKWLYDGRMTS
jgi:RES domain-containing protein